MQDSNPYSILNIPENATIYEIKRAFHQLLFDYHPDLNQSKSSNQVTARIITAYHEVINRAHCNYAARSSSVQEKYSHFFKTDFIPPHSFEHFYQHLHNLFTQLKTIFFGADSFSFFQDYTHLLLDCLYKLEKSRQKKMINALLTGFNLLIEQRKQNFQARKALEFELDPIRDRLIEYFNQVIHEENYFSIKFTAQSCKDPLIHDLSIKFNQAKDPFYKKELFSLLLILILTTETEFFEGWVDYIIQNRIGHTNP